MVNFTVCADGFLALPYDALIAADHREVFFYDTFVCFTVLCDFRLRRRSAVFWCVSGTSRCSARTPRTVGEVENYLVARLFIVNAKSCLVEGADVRLVQGL